MDKDLLENKAKTPSVAIIILNWNGFDDTVECLESLKYLTYPCYKIVLIDNNSQNNEGARLKERFPYVHLIQNKTNRGFAGGNNDGINWALDNNFDYIVNLNNDTVVEADWLSQLVEGLISQAADFGASMVLFYDERNIICSDNDVLFPDGSAFSLGRNTELGESKEPQRIFGACGAGSIYSTDCLKKIAIKGNQYFDESYFAFYEDVDLAIRLNIKKFKGILGQQAIIYHKLSKTAGRYSEFKIFNSEKNRILNELLNFPLLLIPLGELFFFYKLLFGFVYSLINKNSKGGLYRSKMGIIQITCILLKARLWILTNINTILINRRERKLKGFIKFSVTRHFSYNLLRSIR